MKCIKNIYRYLFRDRKAIMEAKEYMQPLFNKSIKESSDKRSIALCISGHMRNYKRLQNNFIEFKNLLSQYGNIDIFISTWDKQNTTHCWSSAHGLSENNSNNIEINIDDIKNIYNTTFINMYNEEFYTSMFSPLRYENFTTKLFNWDARGEHNGIIHSYKMFFLIYQTNLLKLHQEFINDKPYDWVFRLRPDIEFEIYLCKEILKLDQLDNKKLYVPLKNDQFAFGGSEIMNKYSNTFIRSILMYENEIFGDPELICYNSYSNIISETNIINIPRCGALLAENPKSPLRLR